MSNWPGRTKQTICKRFARLTGGIVCLGGGTVRYEWNVDVLKGSAPMLSTAWLSG